MKMKRTLKVLLLVTLAAISLTACNQQIIDTTYTYDRAVLSLPDGEIVEGKVTSWKDFADGDQIQVKINGKSYLVHSSNIVLIAE